MRWSPPPSTRPNEHVIALLDFPPGTSVHQVVDSFLGAWRALLIAADFQAGCALVAVTVAADTVEVRGRAAQAFGTWRTALARACAGPGWTRGWPTRPRRCCSRPARARW